MNLGLMQQGGESGGGKDKEMCEGQDKADDCCGPKGGTSSFTQQVVRAIYAKWLSQARRATGYRRLFSMLAFLALLLGVLYAQRGSTAAFQVHSTLSSVVGLDGDAETMQTPDGVYSWLQGILQAVWKDPICGDGLCESPFEFASYGRFGCRADCGNLMDLQALSSIDIDLYYDFSHQAGSLPAAELLSQASWNLCPEQIQYNSDCYYSDDQTFDNIAGSVHLTLTDIPDGTWSLRVKRDLMSKVRGAVRSTAGVAKAGVVTKMYTAAAGVAAEQAFEQSLLNTAIAAARTPLLGYLPTLWTLTRQTLRDAFDAQQMRNATCLCGAGATAPLQGTFGFVDEATYQGGSNCTGVAQLSDRIWYSNGTSSIYTPPTVDATICAAALANLTTHRNTFNATMLSWLVTQRLGNLATTGKIANRTAVITSIQAALQLQHPELVEPVFNTPKGNDAFNKPAEATIDALGALFVDAPSFVASGPPAHLALYRRRLTQDPGMTFLEWANRAVARLAEIAAQQAEVMAFRVATSSSSSTSVGDIMAAYAAAGANSTWMPDSNATALGALAIPYNLVAWKGGQYEFVTCNIPQRAPDYAGTCQDNTAACTASTTDGIPYSCVQLADNTMVPGNLSSSAYRQNCEVPCDLQLDCAALCDCGDDGCGNRQVCTCPACRALQTDAATDGEFTTIAAAASSSGSNAALFAPINAASGSGRRLLTTSNDEVAAQLAVVAAKVDTLQAAQDSVNSQVDTLKTKVDTANLLAEARAANTQVQDLITAGRADVATGQHVLEGKLDTLLQRQQAVLDAARTATATLASIQGMAERQVAALSGLDAAVKEQVRTISVATQQGLISLTTALSYWKVARRNRASEAKVYRLANTPCTPTSVTDNLFTVNNGISAVEGTARDRSVGLNNRIVGGILLHTWRAQETACPPSRFSVIQSSCSGPPDLASYGIDPAFKPETSSFQPDLVAADDGPMLHIYNCDGLASGRPTYNLVEPATGLTVNARPYCAELFNPRHVPFGFHHFPLHDAPAGFPVWLDINLSEGGATTWLQWLQDALLLDSATRGLAARMVTFNADLGVFALVKVVFDFGAGGSIKATTSITALRMELYDPASTADSARFAAELVLSIAVVVLVLSQAWAVVAAAFRPKGLRTYWSSPAHVVDAISNALLVVCCALWWAFVTRHAKTWSMSLRYDVYQDLQPIANFLDLSGSGEGLTAAWAAIQGLEAAVDLVSWYYALSGINVLLLLGRLLRRMDFQPRLGVITRSLRLALPDLLHFALVAGAVFVGYSMMAFLIFGNSIPQFAGFGVSVNTCFQMMLGDFSDAFQQLGQLTGVQGVAGILFFWTYMLLVFLVLLNFLLAIIVDAFSEVKERTSESTGIHTELARIAADQWRSMVSLLPGGPGRAGRRKLDALLRTWAGTERGGGAGGGDNLSSGRVTEDDDGKRLSSDEAEGASYEGGKGTGAGAAVEEGGASGGRALRVLGQALDESALRAVLSEALQPFDAVGDPAAPKATGGAEGASEEEVAAVAKFVLRRYGTKPDAEAEEEADKAGGEGGPGASLQSERDRLAAALERLAEVQRDLAEAQRQLMAGQKQLAEQQARLLGGDGR